MFGNEHTYAAVLLEILGLKFAYATNGHRIIEIDFINGKRTIYQWSTELKEIVEMVKAARPVISPFLFCNRKDERYIDEATGESHGWDSMWQRFMDRVLKETNVAERFTEHDLRARCVSDADSLGHARALLAHADSRTTDAIYRRKPEIVKPGKGI